MSGLAWTLDRAVPPEPASGGREPLETPPKASKSREMKLKILGKSMKIDENHGRKRGEHTENLSLVIDRLLSQDAAVASSHVAIKLSRWCN